MDSHHTGCSPELLISLENEDLCVYIKGNQHANKRSVPLTAADQALYVAQCRQPIALEVGGKSIGESEWQSVYDAPLFFEQQAYELIIENKSGRLITFDHENPNVRNQVRKVGRGNRLLTGVLNFRNEIGYTDLKLLVDGELYLTITLEIYPTKMSYKQDYRALLEDVNEEIYNLAFDFVKATYSSAGLADERGSLTEFYSLLRARFDELITAVDLILMRPHHQLVSSPVIGRPKPKFMNNMQSMNYLIKHPHQKNYKALNRVKEITYDTQENRLIKYWLRAIMMKLMRIRESYGKLGRQTDQQLMQQIDHYHNVLAARLREPMMQSVSDLMHTESFSLVMQMAVGYRDVYKLYLIMMRGLSLASECYAISTKNVAELYEYWCFIKLGAILRNKYQLISHDVIKVNNKGLFVTLEKGKTSELTFRHPITQEKFKLRYNPMSTQLPTVTQKPDNMLELHKEMTDVTYKYVFDAKYKVDYKCLADGTCYEKPKEEDINTMHRYRDAIVYENKDLGQFERTVFGAFVLFPGYDEDAYQQDMFYQSIEQVGIGGFPFLPSQTALVESFLEQLIDESGHAHYRTIQLPQGVTAYLEDTQIEKRNVLIGNITGSEQLDGIKKHLIYHIPLSKIRNRMLGIEYVAIYESKRNGIGGIQYWGKVKEIQVMPRQKLIKQFPTNRKDLSEEYVVYTLESLEMLPKPILADQGGMRDRRYTNKTLLHYAEGLSELSIKTKEEFELHLTLKRLIAEYHAGTLLDGEQYRAEVGDRVIYMTDDGNIVIERGGEKKYIEIEALKGNLVKLIKSSKLIINLE